MMTLSKKRNALFVCFLCSVLFLFTSCEKAVEATGNAVQLDKVFVVMTKDLVLKTYNANNLTNPLKSVQVTGLESAETILGMDFRPATGQLYVLGNTSRIYVIDQNTGLATALGAAPFTPALSGIIGGFDFNPLVDRIRIVTSTGQNLRVNPETGAVQNVDGVVSNPAGVQISGSAYTNPSPFLFTTELYDIDVNTKKLYKQDPNPGTLTEIGNLTIPNSSGESSFDISFDGIALAAISNNGPASLYQIDLSSGASTNLGTFTDKIIGLSFPVEPVGYAVDTENDLITFALSQTGRSTGQRITNLPAGETIAGIDFRPANGQLYALGTTSRLYTINLTTAVATQVGSTQFSTLLSGTSFGFDFNPTVDRIRVVSNTGQNLRLNPLTGNVAAVDSTLNPGTPSVSAAAYTNNFQGATSTTLYTLDFATDHLYRQDPPNNGVLVDVGPLGLNFEAANGFDIGGTSGTAYALLNGITATNLYTINLSSGMATNVLYLPGPFPVFRGLAIGLGF